MTSCPVCGQHINQAGAPKSRPRQTCSRPCAWIFSHWLIRAHQAEVDSVAVWRLTHGDLVASTRAERIAATADLTGHGHSLTQIAAILGVTCKSVSRYRHEIQTRKAAA